MPRLSILLALPILGLALIGVAQDQAKTKSSGPKTAPKSVDNGKPVRLTQDTHGKAKPAKQIAPHEAKQAAPQEEDAAPVIRRTPRETTPTTTPRTARPRPADAPSATFHEVTPSSSVSGSLEVWFYEQERRRHDDPKQAVRRRAEFRANQRQARIASQKWYGISNSRPLVNPTPLTGAYAHQWGASNHSPFIWNNRSTIVVSRRSGQGLW